jgi:hypothetical protein
VALSARDREHLPLVLLELLEPDLVDPLRRERRRRVAPDRERVGLRAARDRPHAGLRAGLPRVLRLEEAEDGRVRRADVALDRTEDPGLRRGRVRGREAPGEALRAHEVRRVGGGGREEAPDLPEHAFVRAAGGGPSGREAVAQVRDVLVEGAGDLREPRDEGLRVRRGPEGVLRREVLEGDDGAEELVEVPFPPVVAQGLQRLGDRTDQELAGEAVLRREAVRRDRLDPAQERVVPAFPACAGDGAPLVEAVEPPVEAEVRRPLG